MYNQTVIEPSQIGHYQVIRELGRGGMGLVYLAFDPRLERQVAVKSLPGNSHCSYHQLQQEARLLARLNHPNVVQVYDLVEQASQVSLVMEYVEGQTLGQIQAERTLSLHQKLNWLSQIAQGLAHAHQLGIVHNDLKADNILIDGQGNAKISDFGIAQLHHDTINLSAELSGSCYAMSPEQIAGEPSDHTSDLFSFGILAYTLLCDRHPFSCGGSPAQIMQSIRNGAAPKAVELQKILPEGLSNLLAQLLEKDKGKRPQDTKIVAERLISIATDCGLTKHFVATPNEINSNHRLASWWKKLVSSMANYKLLATYCLLLVVVLSSLFWWVNRPGPIRFVAVLPPIIENSGELLPDQQELLVATVYGALSQGVIQTGGVALIAKSEVDKVKGDTQILARALAADELITSHIRCNPSRCEISLSRLVGGRMVVKTRVQWPALYEDMSAIYRESQAQLISLYDASAGLVNARAGMGKESYHSDINIYNLAKLNGQYHKDDLTSLEQLIAEAPKFYPVYTLYRDLALALYGQSQQKQVLDSFERILVQSPADYKTQAQYMINSYWLAITQKDMEKAGVYLEKAKALGVGAASIYQLQARMHLANNQLADAEAAYVKAIKLRPSTELYYNLALCYWWLGEMNKVKLTLNAMLSRYKNDYYGQQLLAAVALAEGDLDLAINAYQTLVAINQQSIDLNNLGLGYMLNQQHQEALVQFQLAVQKSPDNASWLLNLADAEYLLGKKQQAALHYQQVLNLHQGKTDLKSWLERSQAFAHLGMQEQAIKALHQSQKLAPENSEVYFNAALIYTLIGEQISAMVQVQNALDHDVGVVWFRLPWFDRLCQQAGFRDIMTKQNAKERCLAAPG